MQIAGYEITYEPMTDHLMQWFSAADLKRYMEYYERAQKPARRKDLKKFVSELEEFYNATSCSPHVANLITFIYVQLRRVGMTEVWIEESYNKHPDYFFSKLNFANLCLRKKNIDKVAEIFQDKFQLEDHFPDRKKYHFSEARGFWTVLAFYALAKGQREESERWYLFAKQVDPHHPSVKYLEKKLFHIPWYKKLFKNRSRK